MSCDRCKWLDAKHKLRRPVVPAKDELLVSGMIHQDLTHSMVADRAVRSTGQIYCPSGAEHLFHHRMPVGAIVAIPNYKMVVEGYDSDCSGSTTSEWEKDVRSALLVKITSEPRFGPMINRKIIPRMSSVKKWCGHANTRLECSTCCHYIGAITHTELGAAKAADAELFEHLHCDVEVLGSTTDWWILDYCTHKSNCKTTKVLVKKAAII